MSLPDPSNPDEAIPWIRDNLRDGWTPNSDAVRTLLAEYDRLRAIESAVRAWMVTPGRKSTVADIGAAHRRLQDALRVPPCE